MSEKTTLKGSREAAFWFFMANRLEVLIYFAGVFMLKEGEDFYLENGFMVFTEKYHKKRGYCCGSGCRHCPYDYEKVKEPERSRLRNSLSKNTDNN